MTKVLNTALPWLGKGYKGREGHRWAYSAPAYKTQIISFSPFPFYMAYSAATLKRAGHDVNVIDALYDRKVRTEN